MSSLYELAHEALAQRDIKTKLEATHELERAWLAGELDRTDDKALLPCDAGRPARPERVNPTAVPRRGLGTDEGRAAFIHALAHIEFNAINLALDAVYRFRDLPDEYYGDWIRVAREEAEHYVLLRGRLVELGHDYGDFPAHGGLWDMARRTADDVLMRMALVPRLLEARGLDVTPGMIKRLESVGDDKTVEILELIYREELGHVEIGTRWFNFACEQRELDPQQTYISIIESHASERIRKPINIDARRKAGFTDTELAFLDKTSG
ncbi:MAG: ferritin-like domain-containing protein [Gammaproteobacteria bacterium]|nr:ferritin-like domain-containing protein [Gammaproteobacteria bacterium]